MLEAKKVGFPKYKKFFQNGCFYFLESFFLKYTKNMRVESSISGNIRKFFLENIIKFHFPQYKKSLLWENIINFFRTAFFLFFELGLTSALGRSILYYYTTIASAVVALFTEITLCCLSNFSKNHVQITKYKVSLCVFP